MQGAGTTNANGGLAIGTTSATPEVNGLRTLNVGAGGATLAGGGTLFIYNGGVVNNLAASLFDIQADANISPNAGASSLTNAGTLRKSAGTGTATVGVPFTNTGTVEVASGTLAITPATFTNYNAGTTTLSGGTYRVLTNSTFNLPGSTITTLAANTTVELNGPGSVFNAMNSLTTVNGTLKVLGGRTFVPTGGALSLGGTLIVGGTPGDTTSTVTPGVTVGSGGLLKGYGVVSGPVIVNSGGHVAPGGSPGILTLGSSVTFNTGSNLDIAINGTAAGTGYSKLSVTSSAFLTGGNLNVTLGFTPSHSDMFTILSASTLGGTKFSNTPIDMLTLSGVGTFDVFYNPTNVMLTNFTPVPEPGLILLTSAGVIGIAGMVRRRRRLASEGAKVSREVGKTIRES